MVLGRVCQSIDSLFGTHHCHENYQYDPRDWAAAQRPVYAERCRDLRDAS